MPFYDYECAACGKEYDAYSTVENRRQSKCPDCGKKGELVIRHAQPVIFVPYYSVALGCYIRNKKEKQDRMNQLGVEDITGMQHHEVQREADRWRAHREKVNLEKPPPKEFVEMVNRLEAQAPTEDTEQTQEL